MSVLWISNLDQFNSIYFVCITCPCLAGVPFSNRCPCPCKTFEISAIFDRIEFQTLLRPQISTTSTTLTVHGVHSMPDLIKNAADVMSWKVTRYGFSATQFGSTILTSAISLLVSPCSEEESVDLSWCSEESAFELAADMQSSGALKSSKISTLCFPKWAVSELGILSCFIFTSALVRLCVCQIETTSNWKF